MSAIRIALALAMIVALTVSRAHADDPPNIGDRTPDGFVVKCYWNGVFDQTEWFGGQGVVGQFGQLLSPLNGTQKSHAFFSATQEVDDAGKMRFMIRDAYWSSTVSHLHYWSKDNDRPAAGPGGSGQGAISPGDLQISVTEGQKTPNGQSTVNVSVFIDAISDAYKFDVTNNTLEPKGLGVRVSSKTETKKWSANLFGLSASDEPVKPHGTTTIRQEWDVPGTNFHARWLVTRSCETAEVHLIEPKGKQKQYAFDQSDPGKLEVNFKASVEPSSPGILKKMQNDVLFAIDNIGDSKMQWDPNNPNGKPTISGKFLTAKLKYVGLPSKNADFGKKNVQLLVDGAPVESAEVKIFFPKLATNHPGGVKGNPNWFYYWKEGNVCGIASGDTFDNTRPAGEAGYARPEKDSNVRLCMLAASEGYGPRTYTGAAGYGSMQVGGHGKGIKRVAEVLEHERHHIFIYTLRGQVDGDGDAVPDASEAVLDSVKSDPNNPDTFNIAGVFTGDSESAKRARMIYSHIGDGEIRCRKKELDLTIRYYPSKDWAEPGCQSKTPYGP